MARYYSSAMGRFMSPDWSAKPWAVPYADFYNPQSLNLYNYEGNNPLIGTDKDGHCGPCLVVVGVVIAGVAIYKAYKAIDKMIKDGKKLQEKETHFIEGFRGSGNAEELDFRPLAVQVNADAIDAVVKGVAAADAVQSLGETVADGAGALTNPGNATDTMKESVTETLQTGNEVQREQELPDAPTPNLPPTTNPNTVLQGTAEHEGSTHPTERPQ
jgi:RHS repeat-associated protein